jgi:hypothetical protein
MNQIDDAGALALSREHRLGPSGQLGSPCQDRLGAVESTKRGEGLLQQGPKADYLPEGGRIGTHLATISAASREDAGFHP